MEEYPKIRSLVEGIDILFPYLTTRQKKELLDGISRALAEVLGSVWGEREISVDDMREEMRKKLEEKIREIGTIPDDEKGRILSRLERLIPAEELVKLKGKIKLSLINRFELKESVIEAFKKILKENFRGSVELLKKKLKEVKENLEEIKRELEEIKRKSGEEEPGKVPSAKGAQGGESGDSGQDLDKIKSKLKEVERILDSILEGGEKTGEGDKAREFESECEKNLVDFIKKFQRELWEEELSSEINEIKDNIGKIKGDKRISEDSEINREISKIENKINKIKDENGREIEEDIIERYGIRKEIRELCEEIEKSVDISAYLIEGAESIIIDNMNRMIRKDLGLYISWSLGNPMREFYYRMRRGEGV